VETDPEFGISKQFIVAITIDINKNKTTKNKNIENLSIKMETFKKSQLEIQGLKKYNL
jgi:hypothetical protein